MGRISSLRYPKKSHRKLVTLPEPSIALAEFFGIMMGDGGINNPWQANIALNAVADKKYAEYVSRLCVGLFGFAPSSIKRKTHQAIILRLSSTTVVDFLVEHGLCRGNKLKQGLRIPTWILENERYRVACVRGLMDTDGCLYIHKHTVAGKPYKNIGLCFCSFSLELIEQVNAIFEEFGIIPHISNQGRSIYLYKASAVARYLEVFGTSNERVSSVYEEFGGVG
ncbi:MAG: LAGLIDADG family homing endonuclease [Patescibacteria group bacterium]